MCFFLYQEINENSTHFGLFANRLGTIRAENQSFLGQASLHCVYCNANVNFWQPFDRDLYFFVVVLSHKPKLETNFITHHSPLATIMNGASNLNGLFVEAIWIED